MAEYKREIGIMVAVGIVLAIVTTALAISIFPARATSTSAGFVNSSQPTVTETTSSTALPMGCSPSQGEGYYSGTLVTEGTSPAIVCVQFYWFNSTAPAFTGNVMSLFQIEGYTVGGLLGTRDGSPINGASNFTVTAGQSQLVLGGPTNANEGTVVEYSITAKPGASGTYQFLVNGDGEWLGAQSAGNCGPNGEAVAISLVAGNGQPNYMYTGPTMCGSVEVTGTSSATQAFSIPGVSYQIPGSVLLYRIISLTNSTQ